MKHSIYNMLVAINEQNLYSFSQRFFKNFSQKMMAVSQCDEMCGYARNSRQCHSRKERGLFELTKQYQLIRALDVATNI